MPRLSAPATPPHRPTTLLPAPGAGQAGVSVAAVGISHKSAVPPSCPNGSDASCIRCLLKNCLSYGIKGPMCKCFEEVCLSGPLSGGPDRQKMAAQDGN